MIDITSVIISGANLLNPCHRFEYKLNTGLTMRPVVDFEISQKNMTAIEV